MKTLSIQLKPASSGCDMRCAYCFFADGAGGGRKVDNRGVMSAETLETVVQKALAEVEESCAFEFVGGEPTLAGLDFFRRMVDLEDKHNGKNIAVAHTLQTNGLVIDDEWAEFLAKYNFVTNVSIDADKKIHDAMRPDAAGRGTHNRAVLAARRLAESKAEFSVMTVLTRAMASHPDRTYRYFRDRGFKHAVFIPCLEAPGDAPGTSPHALDSATYGKFLNRIFDLWYDDFVKGEYLSIRAFDSFVHLLAGHEAVLGPDRPNLVIEADGAVYPGETHVADRYRLGDIGADSLASLLDGEAMKRYRAEIDACAGGKEWDGMDICRGGARLQRESGGGDLAVAAFSDAYKSFFEHARPRMEFLAARLFGDGER